MSAYCPHCETDLDEATGICPACRWNSRAAALLAQSAELKAQELEQEAARSLTERYRGTQYDIAAERVALAQGGVSRARAFVVVALIAGLVLYGVIISAMGVF
jgi:hypothetical protein